MDIRDYVEYSPDSPSGLLWKVDRHGGKDGRILAAKKGSVAGSKGQLHWEVGVDKEKYLVHRVVWFLLHKEWPALPIDHIDGDGFNNNHTNLRLATHKQNMCNRWMNKNNTSGITGVSELKTNQEHRFIARWHDMNGSPKSKSFSVKKYGYDEARKLAEDFRKSVISELIEQGIYSKRHGSRRNEATDL